MYINVVRACSSLLPSYAFRSIARNLTSNGSTSTLRSTGEQLGVKRRSRHFVRNFLVANGLIVGGGTLYYSYYLTAKEQRQIRVRFEGLRRGFRFVFDRL
jgi:hypothetical protein